MSLLMGIGITAISTETSEASLANDDVLNQTSQSYAQHKIASITDGGYARSGNSCCSNGGCSCK